MTFRGATYLLYMSLVALLLVRLTVSFLLRQKGLYLYRANKSQLYMISILAFMHHFISFA
ncbi:hypothetical protein F4825DRAFT_418055 [Nemania diffusa]|nr:hypothetical protein F4825DRAFT_418055 [Nemania diffusa]